MGYLGILFLFVPQGLLILLSILIVISFVSLYSMKRIVNLTNEQIVNKKGSLVPLAFTAWGFNISALSVALIIMDVISSEIVYLQAIHSEWGGSTEQARTPELIYIVCLALLHAGLLLFSYFSFKKRIISKPKRIKMYIAFIVSSASIWALFMCFVLRVL